MTAEDLSKAYANEKKEIQKNIKIWECTFKYSIVVFIIVFGVYFAVSWQDGFSNETFLRALPFLCFSGFLLIIPPNKLLNIQE